MMPQPAIYLNRVSDKSVIVTGAGAEGDDIGIGRAIALLLAREGAQVVCVDLDLERAEKTREMIVAGGGRALALAGNVTDAADCEAIVEQAVTEIGRLDILINNVGTSTPVALHADDQDKWHQVIDTNLVSAMLMCSFAIPAMVANGGGVVANISSVAGMRAFGGLAYGPSKAALHQLTREITVAHGRQGIRANTIAPGHVMTPFAMSRLPEDMREVRRKVNPLGIEGDAWDVAQAVLYLVSDEARFINGVELAVDGGVDGIGVLAGVALVNDDS